MLDQSSDFTFAPIFTQNAGTVLTGEYRRRGNNGYTQIAGGGTYAEFGDNESKDRGTQFRGYLKTIGDYSVSDQSVGRLRRLPGLGQYFPRPLSDRAKATSCVAVSIWKGRDSRDFWSLNGYYFQGLRPFDDQDKIPVALPLAETRAGQRPVCAGAPT